MKKLLYLIPVVLISIIIFNQFSKSIPEDKKCHIVLKYKDFGPAVTSSKLIGKHWWQWYPAYEDRNTNFDIKVVVYSSPKNLGNIKLKYPVIENKNQDYRYITYADVIEYIHNIKTEDKEYYEGCRAAKNPECHELDYVDKLEEILNNRIDIENCK